MKLIVTLENIISLGLGAFLLLMSGICFIIAMIDTFTKNWRYEHFKCPNCKNHRENGTCGHFRNNHCDCNYYSKRRNKRND